MHKLKNFWQKYDSYISLTILITAVTIITYYRVLIQIEMGPLTDSCDFLSNALLFAGQDMGYYDLSRPPFFSFLLSIIFRISYAFTNAIFILDGLLYIFGIIGLYLILKLKFDDLKSFLGALIYATFPIVLVVMSTGFSDLAGVSFTIWTFYFLILAFKKDTRFFYPLFPFAMLAFLTRYNNALIIFPILLYILINKDKIKSIKEIFAGIIASILIIIPVLIFFLQKTGNIFYPFLSTLGTTSTPRLVESAAYDANLLFFIQKFPLFIGFESILIILIIVFGFLIYGILKLIYAKNEKRVFEGFSKRTKLKIGLFIFLLSVFTLSFGQILSYFSEVLFFISIYLLYDILKNNIKNLDMYFLFLGWFMVFFIFHSAFAIKDNRYFVIMAPAVAYFLILGLSTISNRLTFKIRDTNIVSPLLVIVLTIMILVSTASYLPVIRQANIDTKISNEEIVQACEWLINYDPDYKNKVIYADLWPSFSWFLKTEVKPMPVFKDNQSYYGGVKKFNLTLDDNIAYNKELDKNNADYYFCIRPGLNLTFYKPIKQYGNLIIYEKEK